MKVVECRIKPRGSFHIGEKEAVLEKTSDYIHSDTLFSAICNAYRLLYGNEELKEILKLFADRKPPFLISSAFPYAGETLLFPLPKSEDSLAHGKDKRFKKVEFISRDLFERLAKGEDISEYLQEKNLVQSNRVLLTDDEIKRLGKTEIWNSREVPRVAIDRKTSSSTIYHLGEVSFADHCGLYFFMDLIMPEYEKKVKAAIRVLGDEGIGGERTYGKGLFKPDFIDKDWNWETKNHFTTLSLFYPQKAEGSIVSDGHYELVRRGGWIYSLDATNLRRRTVRMFIEGSVFPALKGVEFYGCLADVKPKDFVNHEVYRYGYAFAVPMEVG